MLSCRLRKKLYHIFNYVFVRSTFITNAGNVLPPHLHLHLHFHSSHFPIFLSLFTHVTRLCIIALSLFLYIFSLYRTLPTLTYHTAGKKLRFGFYHKKNYNSVLSIMHNIPSLSCSLTLKLFLSPSPFPFLSCCSVAFSPALA